jgi:hypothetical protein
MVLTPNRRQLRRREAGRMEPEAKPRTEGRRPVREIGNNSETGPATVILGRHAKALQAVRRESRLAGSTPSGPMRLSRPPVRLPGRQPPPVQRAVSQLAHT